MWVLLFAIFTTKLIFKKGKNILNQLVGVALEAIRLYHPEEKAQINNWPLSPLPQTILHCTDKFDLAKENLF